MGIKTIILIIVIVFFMVFALVFFDILDINFNNSYKEQKVVDKLYIQTTTQF